MHPNFQMPVRSSEYAGGYDIFMPEKGFLYPKQTRALKVPLGFGAEVPFNHVALILPRSGAGVRNGLELNNTVGVIDPDYRGEWMAFLRVKDGETMDWEAGDRLLQFVIVPFASVTLLEVNRLTPTTRGKGGFGSTGA